MVLQLINDLEVVLSSVDSLLFKYVIFIGKRIAIEMCLLEAGPAILKLLS